MRSGQNLVPAMMMNKSPGVAFLISPLNGAKTAQIIHGNDLQASATIDLSRKHWSRQPTTNKT